MLRMPVGTVLGNTPALTSSLQSVRGLGLGFGDLQQVRYALDPKVHAQNLYAVLRVE